MASPCDQLRASAAKCTCVSGACAPSKDCARQLYAQAYQQWFHTKYGFNFMTFPAARKIAYQGAVNNLHERKAALGGEPAMTFTEIAKCPGFNRNLVHQAGYNPMPLIPFGANMHYPSIEKIMPFWTEQFAYPPVMLFILLVIVALTVLMTTRTYMRSRQPTDLSAPTESRSPART